MESLEREYFHKTGTQVHRERDDRGSQVRFPGPRKMKSFSYMAGGGSWIFTEACGELLKD